MTTDDDLRWRLEILDPLARDALRRVLIQDQADRDAIARSCSGSGTSAGLLSERPSS
jgi:hypothetical protein